MADRTDSEKAPEPADSMKAANPSDAGTSSTPEISGPMLDVHAPHESIHTWKSFFIHIAAIAIGLLIAVTLEQSVEYLHHRHQLHQSREALRSEFAQDKKIFEHNIALLQSAEASMEANTAFLHSPSMPREQPTTSLNYSWELLYARSSAWGDAKLGGTLSMMPAEERDLLDRIYSGILHAQDQELAYLASANTAHAIARRAATLGDLTMQDREQLLSVTAQTEGQIVSTRMLLLFTSIPLKTYLDRVDGTK
jgi:hypothetical protein